MPDKKVISGYFMYFRILFHQPVISSINFFCNACANSFKIETVLDFEFVNNNVNRL